MDQMSSKRQKCLDLIRQKCHECCFQSWCRAIKSTKFNQMCLSLNGDWHPIHSWGGSPLSTKARVSHEWPIQERLRTTWSQPIWICGFPTNGSMLYYLLMLLSHLCYHLDLMCVAISDFWSEWHIKNGSTSQFRAFFNGPLISSDAGMTRYSVQVDIISICCQLVHFVNDHCHKSVVCFQSSNSLQARKRIAVDNVIGERSLIGNLNTKF